MRSMTGFGKADGQYGDNLFFSIEISSVNRKQLEIRCSLPPELSGFESLIRQKTGSFISRGSVNVKVMLHPLVFLAHHIRVSLQKQSRGTLTPFCGGGVYEYVVRGITVVFKSSGTGKFAQIVGNFFFLV